MADDADRAADLEQWAREAALDARRAPQTASTETCVECGEDIPVARRAAITTNLCQPCATEREGKKRRGR